VVVAARALPLGAKLTERDVRVVSWAASDRPGESFRTVKEVVDRGLIAAVGEFEPITTAKLAPADTGAGLPPAIPRGMRAISVRVNEVIGVAGFVQPDTRVDVVVTVRGEGGGSRSATVASNVQVLTEGTRQQQGRPASRDEADESTVVTLLVSPDDALRVALAQTEGQIMLILRNPQDQAPTMAKGVETRALFGAVEQPVPVAKPAPRPRPAVVAAPVEAPPPLRTVETVRAGKKSEEVIK
jgi:pilus assembly protein CpaB